MRKSKSATLVTIGLVLASAAGLAVAVGAYRSRLTAAASRLERPRPKPVADVAFVPTPQHAVEKMLELADLSEDDVLYDLGCGDGRILVTAAKKYGCRAVGYDIQQKCVAMSRENARKNGVAHLVRVERKDIFAVDLRDADVVALYLLPSLNKRLVPQLKQLKPGARIVSHRWDIEGVPADKVVDMKPHPVYLWITPLEEESPGGDSPTQTTEP